MLAYRPVTYRLAVAPPRVLRQAPRSQYQLAQRFEEVFGWSDASGDILRTLFHSTTAALGYHVWLNDKGFWRYFGLILGFGQTIGAICDVISLGKRIAGTHPPKES
jgi:hypothetical protein